MTAALRVLNRNPENLMDRTSTKEGDEELGSPLAEYLASLDTHDVEQRCINADPNYGGMWFHCKEHPYVCCGPSLLGRSCQLNRCAAFVVGLHRYDTAVEVIRRAKVLMCLDIAAALTDEEHVPITFGVSASFTSFCPDIHGVDMPPHMHRRLLFGSDQIIA